MMSAAVVAVAIVSYCMSINRGLGGRCKGALGQNVIHHATTIQTHKEHINPGKIKTKSKKKEQVAPRYCLTLANSCGH
jgi:hypothetical protein